MTVQINAAAPGDIVFKNVTKSYGQKAVIKNLNQTFLSGHSYCIMAPSGSGKTTLLRLLSGLEMPDEGMIAGLKTKKVSVVFQEDRLLESYNAIENIRFTCEKNFSVKEIRRLLEEFLDEKDFQKPVSQYSGGMRRKVCLLRALLTASDILLLDEPFTGMDDASRLTAIRLIDTYRADRMFILSSHDRQDAQLLDAQIIFL